MQIYHFGRYQSTIIIRFKGSRFQGNMAEILNHNPEDNPRLSEIYEILLLAGYFRIRIASLKAFDKVIGGIAWCITSSNFEIEVDYNDQMQIGQKIKVSQHICNALINMKCPFTLQPFQLQGLDVNNIFPVVQWLVKFVYETRFQRQKYNRQISVLLGKGILKLEDKGNADQIAIERPQRTRINRQIQKTKYDHPIRVYSALLEYNDATALKMYHKLHNIMTNKLEKERGAKKGEKGLKQEKEKGEQEDLMTYLQNEDQGQAEINLNNFGEVGKISLTKLEKIIEENKHRLEEAIKEQPEESEEPQSSAVEGTTQSGESNDLRPKEKQSEDKQLKSIKIQNDKYEAQMKVLKTQLQNLSTVERQIQGQRKSLQEKRDAISASYQEVRERYQQIQEIGTQIENQLSTKKVNNKVQKFVDTRMKLKQKKIDMKKKAKGQLEELEEVRVRVEASVPEIDEEAFKNMLEEADLKKEIYDKKYEELTKINQELAILQRKAQNFTSAAEIAQYHQRFVQLFESINCSIEEKRSIFNEMTNLEGIRKLIANYQQFLDNAKVGVAGARKKKDKLELVNNLKEILEGFDMNYRNARVTLQKLKSSRESSYGSYMALIKLEREYLKVLRNFKVQYENIEKLYH